MAKYNHNESLGKNAMRGVDITEPELPTEITSSADDFPLPDEFWDSIYEYLQDKYGRDAGKYAQSYGVEVIVSDIEWEDMQKGD